MALRRPRARDNHVIIDAFAVFCGLILSSPLLLFLLLLLQFVRLPLYTWVFTGLLIICMIIVLIRWWQKPLIMPFVGSVGMRFRPALLNIVIWSVSAGMVKGNCRAERHSWESPSIVWFRKGVFWYTIQNCFVVNGCSFSMKRIIIVLSTIMFRLLFENNQNECKLNE